MNSPGASIYLKHVLPYTRTTYVWIPPCRSLPLIPSYSSPSSIPESGHLPPGQGPQPSFAREKGTGHMSWTSSPPPQPLIGIHWHSSRAYPSPSRSLPWWCAADNGNPALSLLHSIPPPPESVSSPHFELRDQPQL